MYINKHPETQLKDAIVMFTDAIDSTWCDTIINEYKETDLWKESYFHSKKQGIRTCNEIKLPESLLEKEIFNVVGKCLKGYNEIFLTTASTDEGYTLLRYKEGQSIGQHMDDTTGLGRVLSCSILLNDEFEGGQFSFWGGETIISPAKGSVLMFPANFMYPHEIKPIISGTRYSIITWLG